MIVSAILTTLVLSGLVHAAPLELEVGVQPHDFGQPSNPVTVNITAPKNAPFCFPSLVFVMPLGLPADNTNWWCDPATEYAFLGFSYEVTACAYCDACLAMSAEIPIWTNVGQSRAQLHREFADIRNHFQSRYVRLYGVCDRDGF